MGLIIFCYKCWCKFGKNIPLPDKDVSIYDYLEGEVGHTMSLNPVDDQ